MTETMYREVSIRPATGGSGEWQAGEVGDELIEGVEGMREILREGGADEVYDLGVDELPDEIGGGADIRGLVVDEPARILLAVYRLDGDVRLIYTGLEPADGA